jgi:hypothetical protein
MKEADAIAIRIERIRRLVSIVGLTAIAVCLASGLVSSIAGIDWLAARAFIAAAAVLVLMPIGSVIAVFIVEIARRDWWFASAALGVLLLIGYRLSTLAR